MRCFNCPAAAVFSTALGLMAAAPSSAAVLSVQSAVLELTVSELPSIGLTGNLDSLFVSSATGGFVLPASVFTGSATVPTQLFTGISLISSLMLSATNGPLNAAPGGGIGGGFGGAGALQGAAVIGIVGGLVNLTIPLAAVGGGGIVQSGAASLMVTVTGHIWTTGIAIITGVGTIPTPSGFTNTVSLAGFDNRTGAHAGSVLLVTPFRAPTNAAGTLVGFTTLSLVFVPEPGVLLLAGAVAAGLLLAGRKRRGG